jgi:hypothetical protein
MYGTILNRPGFQVFRSQSEALTWLGLNEAAIREATAGLQDPAEESPEADSPSDPAAPGGAARKRCESGNSC